MKKLKSLLAALLAVTMALTATACGNTDGQQEGGVSTSIDPSTVLEENSDVIHAFGGGSSGGGYYTISNVLSQYFTDNGFGNFIYLIMVVMRRTDVKTAPGEDSWRSCFT